MADNLLLPVSLEQMVGSDDAIFVAAVYVYDAGTTDLKNVYTDATLSTAAANPIIADGDGVIPARYVGTGSYKLVIKDTEGYPTEELSSHWTTFKTIDNLPGALDTSSYSSDKAIPITPVVSKTTDYTALTTDQGKILDVDPTGGNVQITLPSAVTAGDNWRLTVKHTGSANSITLATVGAQTIDGEGSFLISNQYESVTVVSDGANWLVSETGRRIELIVLPRGYIDGCIVSNNVSDAANDVNVSIGVCRDITNTVNITNDAVITGKQLDANWTAGSLAGMRYSGAGITNGSYGLFLARTEASSAGELYAYPLTAGTDASTLAFHATVLAALQAETGGADYAYIRLIMPIVRESSAIRPFLQYGDDVFWMSQARDVSEAVANTNPQLRALTLPVGLKVLANLNVYNDSAVSNTLLVTSPDQTDNVPGASFQTIASTAGTVVPSSIETRVYTDTSARVRTRNSAAGGALRIFVNGFSFSRGKNT